VNFLEILYHLNRARSRLYWDKEKLNRYQGKKIRAIVRYADKYVQFYHKKFREFRVDVEAIRTVHDLTKLPIIKKAEFKKNNAEQLVSTEFDFRNLKRVRTSGSTGTPFEMFLTGNEDAWRKAIYMRANITCGQKPHDRWVVLTSPTHFRDTSNIQRLFGIYAQECISLFESTDSKIRQIEAAKPDILDGYSGSLFMLAKELKHRGLKSIRPKRMFGNAELIDKVSRGLIEEVFQAPYCDQFGSAEVDRSAWQCLKRQGYHMDVDSVITEFLDDDGQPVSSGECGEVTYTSLFNFAMPLIRYAIGDVGKPSAETCSCGITLPLMEVVEGRKDSFLKLPNSRLISPMVFNFAVSRFEFYTLIDQFQIHQRAINGFEVNLKLYKNDLSQDFLKTAFINHINKFFDMGDNVNFQVEFVDDIPLSKTGKLMSVWSDL
jgi:phenylacetate-CoA ligase